MLFEDMMLKSKIIRLLVINMLMMNYVNGRLFISITVGTRGLRDVGKNNWDAAYEKNCCCWCVIVAIVKCMLPDASILLKYIHCLILKRATK